MGFQITISTELACAMISAGSIILSALISMAISKHTAAKEIERMKLTWAREDSVSSDDEFSEMVKLVVLYMSGTTVGPYEALAAIAALCVKESGEITVPLDALYHAMKRRDYDEIDKQLDNVIRVRRSGK